MKQKIIAIVMVVMLLMSVAACAKQEVPTTTTENTPVQEAVATEETTAPISDEVFEWKLATTMQDDHPISVGYKAMADAVAERTNGRLMITVYPNSQLGDAKDLIDSVAINAIQICHAGLGAISTRNEKLKIFDAPYIFRDYKQLLAFAAGPECAAIFDELAASSGIRVAGVLYYGTRELTANKKVTTPADLTGFKLRVPDEPMGLAYGKALGASPTPVAFSEVYLALQQGVIDGQENPVNTIKSAKFYEVQKYLMLTNHIVANQATFISDEALNSLPEDLKAILVEELANYHQSVSETIASGEQGTLQFLEEQGMEVVEVDVDAFKANCEGLYKEFESMWTPELYAASQQY